jgi:pantoate--beta-alanine ligase
MITAVSREDLAEARGKLDGRVALVPTMGALHAGHAALIDRARAIADSVVVSIFVNPLQFAAGEDLDRYPRTLEADLDLVARLGGDLVWAPTPDVVYPHGQPTVTVRPGRVGDTYEGAARPGHFAGVLTVVTKLLTSTRPDVAVFGRKDAQQLCLVQRMVSDLDLGVDIEPHPIVRDRDGLALSSRNRFLSAAERAAALAIPRAIATGSRDAARAVLAASDLDVDYCDLVDPVTFAPLEQDTGGLLIITATSGTTRLLDNAFLGEVA